MRRRALQNGELDTHNAWPDPHLPEVQRYELLDKAVRETRWAFDQLRLEGKPLNLKLAKVRDSADQWEADHR